MQIYKLRTVLWSEKSTHIANTLIYMGQQPEPLRTTKRKLGRTMEYTISTKYVACSRDPMIRKINRCLAFVLMVSAIKGFNWTSNIFKFHTHITDNEESFMNKILSNTCQLIRKLPMCTGKNQKIIEV